MNSLLTGALTAAVLAGGLLAAAPGVRATAEAKRAVSAPAGTAIVQESPTVVPEAAGMLLLGTGLAGLAAAARRRRKQNRDGA